MSRPERVNYWLTIGLLLGYYFLLEIFEFYISLAPGLRVQFTVKPPYLILKTFISTYTNISLVF